MIPNGTHTTPYGHTTCEARKYSAYIVGRILIYSRVCKSNISTFRPSRLCHHAGHSQGGAASSAVHSVSIHADSLPLVCLLLSRKNVHWYLPSICKGGIQSLSKGIDQQTSSSQLKTLLETDWVGIWPTVHPLLRKAVRNRLSQSGARQ